MKNAIVAFAPSPGSHLPMQSRLFSAGRGSWRSSLFTSPRWGEVAAPSRRERGRYSVGGNVLRIMSRTSSKFSYTSVLLNLRTKKPAFSSIRVRRASCAISSGVECVTPSTSTASLPSNVTKSTMKPLMTCCRRNFQRLSWRARRACQSFASALVCAERNRFALVLNLSMPPYPDCAAIRPLPGGERYNTLGAFA